MENSISVSLEQTLNMNERQEYTGKSDAQRCPLMKPEQQDSFFKVDTAKLLKIDIKKKDFEGWEEGKLTSPNCFSS